MDELLVDMGIRGCDRVADLVDMADYRARKSRLLAELVQTGGGDAADEFPTLEDPAELARFVMAAGAGLSSSRAARLSQVRPHTGPEPGGAVLRWQPRPLST